MHAIAVAKFKGRALRWYRNNSAKYNTYRKLVDALKESFSLSTEAIKAALAGLAFNPDVENLRQFHERFNSILESGPTPLAAGEPVKLYLAALGRGDSSLVRDIIMTKDISQLSVSQLQRSLQAKFDQISVVYNEAGVNTETSGRAYSTAKKTLEVGPDSGLQQVKEA